MTLFVLLIVLIWYPETYSGESIGIMQTFAPLSFSENLENGVHFLGFLALCQTKIFWQELSRVSCTLLN